MFTPHPLFFPRYFPIIRFKSNLRLVTNDYTLSGFRIHTRCIGNQTHDLLIQNFEYFVSFSNVASWFEKVVLPSVAIYKFYRRPVFKYLYNNIVSGCVKIEQ